MPYIQLRDRQFSIRRGQLRVGTSADADVKVPGAESPAAQAVVEMGADDHVAIRRATTEAVVKVNGVLLGVEPTPLMHGDKIEIAGVELLFGDDRRAGSTQYLGAAKVAAAPASRPAPGKATAATGGRLVSLVDGREYVIRPEGVTFGRDAGCEIVIPATEVSRRHAMVTPGEGGYVLTDLSTNGVLVNGERIAKTRTLGRGDVIRIGAEEFRFYADVAPGGAPAPAAPAERPDTPRVPVPPAAMAGVAAGSAASRPAAESAARAAPPSSPAPASPPVSPPPSAPLRPAPAPASGAAAAASASPAPPKPRAALATLEIINEGVLKGKRFEIRSPLTHIGRGAHNDVVISDDSVSDSHAKIQKRESGWYVVDMSSTNGTYVGGRRITDEKQLVGSPDIRFGGVKMVFQVATEAAEDAKGTRAIAGMRAQARQASAAQRPTPPVAEPTETPAARGISGWIWVLLLILVAAMVYFILGGAE
jgi:pSer/pThr/pTyr-binding forkhead associated (FHA) protein